MKSRAIFSKILIVIIFISFNKSMFTMDDSKKISYAEISLLELIPSEVTSNILNHSTNLLNLKSYLEIARLSKECYKISLHLYQTELMHITYEILMTFSPQLAKVFKKSRFFYLRKTFEETNDWVTAIFKDISIKKLYQVFNIEDQFNDELKSEIELVNLLLQVNSDPIFIPNDFTPTVSMDSFTLSDYLVLLDELSLWSILDKIRTFNMNLALLYDDSQEAKILVNNETKYGLNNLILLLCLSGSFEFLERELQKNDINFCSNPNDFDGFLGAIFRFASINRKAFNLFGLLDIFIKYNLKISENFYQSLVNAFNEQFSLLNEDHKEILNLLIKKFQLLKQT